MNKRLVDLTFYLLFFTLGLILYINLPENREVRGYERLDGVKFRTNFSHQTITHTNYTLEKITNNVVTSNVVFDYKYNFVVLTNYVTHTNYVLKETLVTITNVINQTNEPAGDDNINMNISDSRYQYEPSVPRITQPPISVFK